MRRFDWPTLARLLILVTVCSVAIQLWKATHSVNRIMANRRLSLNYSMESQRKKEVEIRTDVKRILYWTTFNNREDFRFGTGTEPFEDCGHRMCEATNDRNLLEYSDAVIFNLNNIEMEDLPSYRRMDQSWVLVNGESPFHSKILDIDGLFNLTMSYKADSDIPFAQGKVVQMSDHDRMVFERSYERYNWAYGKTKLVAWFVSHCHTPSKREQFVKELKKFIPIDIYGECGSLNCGKGNYECDTILAKYYKFYLSFENSLCKDYVTEKLWNPLMSGVVPIVMGYANYKSILPNNSYIDVKDFKYIRQLAQFLQSLDKDDESYNKYFEWRRRERAGTMRFKDAFCQLCKKLNNDEDTPKTLDDFSLWNSKILNCQTPSEYFSSFIDRKAWLDDAMKEAEMRAKESENAAQATNSTV